MNLTASIKQLFPNARLFEHFMVRDDSNGDGPYISEWKLTQPQPTQIELEAAWEIIKDQLLPKSDKELLTDARLEIGRLNRSIDSLSTDVQAIIDTIVV